MTPSAAAGIVKSVYWKPQIDWRIDAITVLSEIRYQTVRTNEVGVKGNYAAARSAWSGKAKGLLFVDPEATRQQRLTAYLVAPRYIVDAHFVIVDPAEDPRKHYAIAERRLRHGQCFSQPYLGLRECPALVRPILDGREREALEADGFYAEVPRRDMGWMLHHIDWEHDCASVSFHAVMRHGRIDTSLER